MASMRAVEKRTSQFEGWLNLELQATEERKRIQPTQSGNDFIHSTSSVVCPAHRFTNKITNVTK